MRPTSDTAAAQAKRMYENGLSVQAIGHELQTGPKIVRELLAESGITPRNGRPKTACGAVKDLTRKTGWQWNLGPDRVSKPVSIVIPTPQSEGRSSTRLSRQLALENAARGIKTGL